MLQLNVSVYLVHGLVAVLSRRRHGLLKSEEAVKCFQEVTVYEFGVELHSSPLVLQRNLEQDHLILPVLQEIILIILTLKINISRNIINNGRVEWLQMVKLLDRFKEPCQLLVVAVLLKNTSYLINHVQELTYDNRE